MSIQQPDPSRGVRVYLDGKVVKRSANLRGVLDYARTHGVHAVYVDPNNRSKPESDGAWVVFIFDNGAHCTTEWASFTVACQWIMARRSWGMHKRKYTAEPGTVVYDA